MKSKNPAARAAVYDDAEVRKIFPMADLIRESIDDAAPRPKTPYYTDVSSAVVSAPSTRRRRSTPTAPRPGPTQLIVDVLHDKVLL